MVIRLHCEDCNAKIKVPDGAEGKNIKCPRCGAIHRVPSAQTVPADEPSISTTPPSDADLDSLASALGATPHDDDEDLQQVSSSNHLADETEPPDEDDDWSHEDQPADEHNPLDALAAMADQEQDVIDHDDEQYDEKDEYNDDEHDEPDQPSAHSQIKLDLSLEQADPDYGVAMAAGANYDPGIAPIAVKPKPKPTPNPSIPIAQPAEQADTRPESPNIDDAGPTPLSMNRPSPRPQPKAIPLADPAKTRSTSHSHASGQPYTHMLIAAWVLRVLAGLSVGGAVKLMLVASSLQWPTGDCLVVLLVGLVAAAAVWGLAEIVFAVRDMAHRNANR